MAERLKAPVLKTGKGATLSWVRIPVSPPLNWFIFIIHFINLDDEILFKLNKGDKVQINCDNNKIIDMFKIFKI